MWATRRWALLGRSLLEGAEKVKLFGEEIEVKAEICRLPGVSGHADNQGLIRWISSLEEKPRRVFVTHGDDAVCELFKNRLTRELGLQADAPYSGWVYDLAAGEYLEKAEPVRIRKERKRERRPRRRAASLRNCWRLARG